MKKNVKVIIISLAVGIILGLLLHPCTWCILEIFLPNLGFEHPWYYYGQYNRVRNIIKDMPNVEILDVGLHKDTSLESFGFTLRIDGHRDVQVYIGEDTEEIRETDKQRLRMLIQKKIDSNKQVESISPPAGGENSHP